MNDLQRTIYEVSSALLWPVLVAVIVCLVWVLIELGSMLYEVWLRFRYRDLDALQARALRARKAFADGKPRSAYRYLQENTYSLVVVRFLYDLIRNYQGERLEAKPLKLLQEYEFYSVKRLERTRMLTRFGPMLGLMGTLIPLSPALIGLAEGNIDQLSENLVTAFSVTVLGLLIGGLSFVVSIVRDRMYSQDISDMEYLLELLQGDDGRLSAGRRRRSNGAWDDHPVVAYEDVDEDPAATSQLPVVSAAVAESLSADEGSSAATDVADQAAVEPSTPGSSSPPEPHDERVGGVNDPSTQHADAPEERIVRTADVPPESAPKPIGPPVKPPSTPPTSFDDPDLSWRTDDDPFACLGPVDLSKDAEEPESSGS